MLDNQISEVEGKVSSETEKIKEMVGLIEKAPKKAAKKADKKDAPKADKKAEKKEEPKEEKEAPKADDKKKLCFAVWLLGFWFCELLLSLLTKKTYVVFV